jgi:hypothetical protein
VRAALLHVGQDAHRARRQRDRHVRNSILGPIDLQVGSFPAGSLIKAINQKPIAESAVVLPVRKMTAVNDHLSASGRFDMERGSQQRQMLTSPGL